MTKILLLDGNSLTYRAFFALPTDMATAGGQVTNAVFGFTSMLINLVKPFQKSDLVPALELAHARHTELQALGGEVRSLEERLEARKLIDRAKGRLMDCLLYTSPSPRDRSVSRMPSSA